LLHVIQATCGRYNWTLQQDDIPYTAKNTINFLSENVNFIKPYKTYWLPNSLDYNPVDYAIWGAFLEKVYHGRKVTAIELLRLATIKEWRSLSQRIIDRSMHEWRQRLEQVVEKQRITLNMFSDYLNTCQTTVYDKTIILI